MRVNITDVRIVGQKRHLVRFNVSILDERDVPQVTIEGWLYDEHGGVHKPTLYTGRNRFPSKRVLQVRDDMLDGLKAALEAGPNTAPLLEQIKAAGDAERAAAELEPGVECGTVDIGSGDEGNTTAG
jgi:hypothetical protein